MQTGRVQLCRSCGARYAPDRFACTACDVGLVEEAPHRRVLTFEGDGVGVPVEGRTFKQRTELVDHLEREEVLHRWEEHVLVVARDDLDLVTAVLAEADDEAGEEVGYYLDDWLPDQQGELTARLAEEGIPNRWDGSELVVAEQHADRVEEIIDEIDHPDALPVDDDEGDGGGELLGALFVAADVLHRDPSDPVAVRDLLDIAERAEAAPPPYGIDVAEWDGIRRMAGEVADLLGEQADEEQVVAAARALRDALRDMV